MILPTLACIIGVLPITQFVLGSTLPRSHSSSVRIDRVRAIDGAVALKVIPGLEYVTLLVDNTDISSPGQFGVAQRRTMMDLLQTWTVGDESLTCVDNSEWTSPTPSFMCRNRASIDQYKAFYFYCTPERSNSCHVLAHPKPASGARVKILPPPSQSSF